MRWLKATARDRSPRSHRPHQFRHSLTWTDAEAFEAVCREEYNRHRASLDELVKQVRQRVFLPVLVDYQIPLKLEVNDYRSDKTEALPELQLGK